MALAGKFDAAEWRFFDTRKREMKKDSVWGSKVWGGDAFDIDIEARLGPKGSSRVLRSGEEKGFRGSSVQNV